MDRVDIVVILGSESDLETVRNSKLPTILDVVGVNYETAVISAHRNPRELDAFVTRCVNHDAKVFIGVAGMAAALPGSIVSSLQAIDKMLPVIGVPLPEYPNSHDALFSIVRLPGGIPAGVCGIGASGLQNAALFACQIVALTDELVSKRLTNYMSTNVKPPRFDVKLTEEKS